MADTPDDMSHNKGEQIAIFAMGCFWCGESAFRDDTGKPLKGIHTLRVGYAGGDKPNPTYHDHPGYKESVKITYDPSMISYEKLLSIFWHNVDPFDENGQFCDKGFPYTSVIFYMNEEQKRLAENSKKRVETALDKEVATKIVIYTKYIDAEDYHQDYKDKNPIRYKFYRWNCGRDKRLKEIDLEKFWKED